MNNDKALLYGSYVIITFNGQDRVYKHDQNGNLMEYHSPLFITLKKEMELLAGMYSAAIKQNAAIIAGQAPRRKKKHDKKNDI